MPVNRTLCPAERADTWARQIGGELENRFGCGQGFNCSHATAAESAIDECRETIGARVSECVIARELRPRTAVDRLRIGSEWVPDNIGPVFGGRSEILN